MKINFKEINVYQARSGAIMLSCGKNLLFTLKKEQLNDFCLYDLEDFSEEDYKKYYFEKLNEEQKHDRT